MTLCKFGWHKWAPWEFSHHAREWRHTEMQSVSVFVRTCECCKKPDRMITKPIEKFP